MSVESLDITDRVAGASYLLVRAVLLATTAWSYRSYKQLAQFNAPHPHKAIEMMQFAHTTIDYVLAQNIGAIALIDRGMRPFYHPLIVAGRSRFTPDAPRPPIYFLNPQGFQGFERRVVRSALNIARTAAQKGSSRETILRRRSATATLDAFPAEHPYLYSHRDNPVLIMDTCVHSGDSIRPVLKGMKELGFEDVRFGVVCNDSDDPKTAPAVDLVLTNIDPLGGCYPFGLDRLTERRYSSTHSAPATKAKRIASGMLLRRNLRTAIREIY